MSATMACIDEDTALALIEGRILSSSRHEVERHLESCDACRELCAELAQIEVGTQSFAASAGDTVRLQERGSIAPGSMVGPYRIHGEIGRGSAGTVYRAVDTTRGVTVALKHVVDPALRQRFAREAATLARLDHPAIVRYVGHGDLRDGMYLAMEWLEGEDLQQRLATTQGRGAGGGPLGWRAARAIGLRIAGALGQAHALGCIHRDLSPRNVFLPSGKVEEAKLLDFGLVRLVDPAALDATRTEAVVGTPFYMSPEQVRDPHRVDGRSDMFGLGVLLYEVTTGVRPFLGDQLFTLWDQIVNHTPLSMQSLTHEPLPAAFVALVDSLLQKDPRARPASAANVEGALAAISPSLDAYPWRSAPPPEARRPSAPPVRVPPYPVPPTSLSPVHVAPLAPLASLAPAPLVSARSPALSEAPSRPVGPLTFLVLGAVGMAILGGLGTAAVLLAQHFSSVGDGASPALDASPSAPIAPAAPGNVAHPGAATPAIVAHDPASAFQCVGSTETTLRGGRYTVDAEHLWAVEVTGCHVTLEDCDITGPSQIVGEAELTLRRCQVHGSFTLVGKPTLRLDHTRLPGSAKIVGQGHVVQVGG